MSSLHQTNLSLTFGPPGDFHSEVFRELPSFLYEIARQKNSFTYDDLIQKAVAIKAKAETEETFREIFNLFQRPALLSATLILSVSAIVEASISAGASAGGSELQGLTSDLTLLGVSRLDSKPVLILNKEESRSLSVTFVLMMPTLISSQEMLDSSQKNEIESFLMAEAKRASLDKILELSQRYEEFFFAEGFKSQVHRVMESLLSSLVVPGSYHYGFNHKLRLEIDELDKLQKIQAIFSAHFDADSPEIKIIQELIDRCRGILYQSFLVNFPSSANFSKVTTEGMSKAFQEIQYLFERADTQAKLLEVREKYSPAYLDRLKDQGASLIDTIFKARQVIFQEGGVATLHGFIPASDDYYQESYDYFYAIATVPGCVVAEIFSKNLSEVVYEVSDERLQKAIDSIFALKADQSYYIGWGSALEEDYRASSKSEIMASVVLFRPEFFTGSSFIDSKVKRAMEEILIAKVASGTFTSAEALNDFANRFVGTPVFARRRFKSRKGLTRLETNLRAAIEVKKHELGFVDVVVATPGAGHAGAATAMVVGLGAQETSESAVSNPVSESMKVASTPFWRNIFKSDLKTTSYELSPSDLKWAPKPHAPYEEL